MNLLIISPKQRARWYHRLYLVFLILIGLPTALAVGHMLYYRHFEPWAPFVICLPLFSLWIGYRAILFIAVGNKAFGRREPGSADAVQSVRQVQVPPPSVQTVNASVINKMAELRKVRSGGVVAWVLLLYFLPSVPAVPLSCAVTWISAIIVFRRWCRRRTVIAAEKELPNLKRAAKSVYFRGLWAFLWRSLAAFICIAGAMAYASDDPLEGARHFGGIIGCWLISMPFTLDVPYRCWRKLVAICEDSESNPTFETGDPTH